MERVEVRPIALDKYHSTREDILEGLMIHEQELLSVQWADGAHDEVVHVEKSKEITLCGIDVVSIEVSRAFLYVTYRGTVCKVYLNEPVFDKYLECERVSKWTEHT